MIKTMRLREAAVALGISLPNLRQKARTDPDFPTLILLGEKSTVIRESDLEKYLEKKSKPRVTNPAETTS